MIEREIIKINLKKYICIYTDENNYGKTYNHGCGLLFKKKI